MMSLSNAPMTTGQRFQQLLTNLRLTDDQRSDGITKHSGVRLCLNRHYHGVSSSTENSFLVGSWGKQTEIRPPRDIDLYFVLPFSVYTRFESRTGNKQSQLLQEVKDVLSRSYPTTNMRGDGQVVVVPFSSYSVEVVPAFALSGSYWICNTHNGGSYKTTYPAAEQNNVESSNTVTKGNTRDLIRMMKRWQEFCSVPMKSFWIELLAVEFLRTWQHAGNSTVYYDWMVRDFLKFIIAKANTSLFVPGGYEFISLGDAWLSRAETARLRAEKACEYDTNKLPTLAGEEWQKVFGTFIPIA